MPPTHLEDLSSIRSALLKGAATLCATSGTPDLDAEVLLAHVIKKSKEYLLTYPEQILTRPQVNRFTSLITRRAHQEPVAYLIHHKAFFDLDFFINKHVLVPRPDTELLVEQAIRLLKSVPSPHVVDVGTGSGVIAISVKKRFPKAKMWAVDNSRQALRVAHKNAHTLRAPITFLHGSLLEPTKQLKFDCILSNPPYLTAKEMHNPQLSHEPRAALYGGTAGLEVYRRLFSQVAAHLKPQGVILIEIGSGQATALTSIIQKILPQSQVNLKQDLAGHDRLLIIQTK